MFVVVGPLGRPPNSIAAVCIPAKPLLDFVGAVPPYVQELPSYSSDAPVLGGPINPPTAKPAS